MKINKIWLTASIALIATGAAAQNTFPASGNVGIGTTAPVGLLSVASPNPGTWSVGPIGWSSSYSLFGPNVASTTGAALGISYSTTDDMANIVALAPGVAWKPLRIAASQISFATNTANGGTTVTINSSGNVGIGTTAPGASLEVNGSVKLTSDSGASLTFQDGSVQTVAWNGTLAGADYAESVDVTGDRSKYEPGDVLVIDPESERTFLKSATPYSTKVMGIYSTKPGVLGRPATAGEAQLKGQVPMAMVGIVPTKVSAENGPIEPGDLLVTSSKMGYAMKGTDRNQMLGAVIGKALGHLGAGTGLIEVAVSLQ